MHGQTFNNNNNKKTKITNENKQLFVQKKFVLKKVKKSGLNVVVNFKFDFVIFFFQPILCV